MAARDKLDIGLVSQVSGDWDPQEGSVRLRIEAERLDQPQDLLIAANDIQPLISLLLVLSGKAGAATPHVPGVERYAIPLPVDTLGLGQTDDGTTVLELEIGCTALAFSLPSRACRQLGESLLTLSGSDGQSAN